MVRKFNFFGLILQDFFIILLDFYNLVKSNKKEKLLGPVKWVQQGYENEWKMQGIKGRGLGRQGKC